MPLSNSHQRSHRYRLTPWLMEPAGSMPEKTLKFVDGGTTGMRKNGINSMEWIDREILSQKDVETMIHT